MKITDSLSRLFVGEKQNRRITLGSEVHTRRSHGRCKASGTDTHQRSPRHDHSGPSGTSQGPLRSDVTFDPAYADKCGDWAESQAVDHLWGEPDRNARSFDAHISSHQSQHDDEFYGHSPSLVPRQTVTDHSWDLYRACPELRLDQMIAGPSATTDVTRLAALPSAGSGSQGQRGISDPVSVGPDQCTRTTEPPPLSTIPVTFPQHFGLIDRSTRIVPITFTGTTVTIPMTLRDGTIIDRTVQYPAQTVHFHIPEGFRKRKLLPWLDSVDLRAAVRACYPGLHEDRREAIVESALPALVCAYYHEDECNRSLFRAEDEDTSAHWDAVHGDDQDDSKWWTDRDEWRKFLREREAYEHRASCSIREPCKRKPTASSRRRYHSGEQISRDLRSRTVFGIPVVSLPPAE
ncbi:hypothetical protein I317_03969 [Kwoniella heveanensis CBS 569]|uniref:Uncharacterized protein n=1 Tax=Kwoniella heveanensis BCC8398 TaxID=1296120 RepID=A0A1B9H425_9TREE|nr:hypothetical protein I316_00232 [Kwoniella heveanensis BCC8398]OCF42234.1 hypothetical protein I317_03969 [Kwoniella heveanensis CBS 569]